MPQVWFATFNKLYRLSNSIHDSPNKMQRSPWPRNILFWALMAPLTPGAAVVLVVCFSEYFFSSCAMTAILLIFCTCMQWHFRLILCETRECILVEPPCLCILLIYSAIPAFAWEVCLILFDDYDDCALLVFGQHNLAQIQIVHMFII